MSTDSRRKPAAKMPPPKVSLASAPFSDVVTRTKAETQAAKTYSETAERAWSELDARAATRLPS
jgi:hypothetical protein